MHNSDLITPQHLARKAVIDIRQSTPHQVVSHQESLRLQYALGERARQLGWPAAVIDIIDDDLGLTAATAHHRAGFNTLVAQVTLEQVGLILSYDVTRLSRNCSDWYPLLDLCGYKGCSAGNAGSRLSSAPRDEVHSSCPPELARLVRLALLLGNECGRRDARRLTPGADRSCVRIQLRCPI